MKVDGGEKCVVATETGLLVMISPPSERFIASADLVLSDDIVQPAYMDVGIAATAIKYGQERG